jgi:hypothetical protein
MKTSKLWSAAARLCATPLWILQVQMGLANPKRRRTKPCRRTPNRFFSSLLRLSSEVRRPEMFYEKDAANDARDELGFVSRFIVRCVVELN